MNVRGKHWVNLGGQELVNIIGLDDGPTDHLEDSHEH
jgi:hypothetical protein